MSAVIVSDRDMEKLRQLASVLIPPNGPLPAAGELADFSLLACAAVKACGNSDSEIRAAVDAVPADIDWAGARAFCLSDPERFRLASLLVSAAYVMAPSVLRHLGYPEDRRQPANVEDFAEEYETGILDAVTDRGPRYRIA